MRDFEKKTRAYALKNAVAHGGKAKSGAVISGLFNEGLKKSDAGKFAKEILKIVSEVNSLKFPEQEKEFEKIKDEISERNHREGLEELPNVGKNGVVMRFAPSPSGPFHIGHAMTASLSFLYVKKYGGKFYVRIEDTNPENIYPLAYKMIESESAWLFENSAEILIQSYRMDLYYKCAGELIEKKAAYVCTCSSDEFEKYSDGKTNCPCRKSSVEENMRRWKNMLSESGFRQGEAVLRFKSDMKHPNPAMRDFPLARINLTKHPLQGNKYRVWPLMNLAVTVDDIETNVTHVIRAKDHIDNAKRQEMMFKVLGKKFPWTGFLGRFHFKDLDLSATKMRIAIEEKKYSGWDDPRLPTIASLKKRGYKPQAFWKFAEQIGLSGSDKVMDRKEFFLLLDNFNRQKF